MLHGVGSGADSWKGQLESLSREFRVVAWDAPGYGLSTHVEPAQPSADDYAVRWEAFLDGLGLNVVTLVGHSLEAITAARFAARVAESRQPRRAGLPFDRPRAPAGRRACAIEERASERSARAWAARASGQARARSCFEGATKEQREAVIEVMARVDPKGYTQAVELLAGADTGSDVQRLKAELPVDFVYGEKDTIVPPASVLRLAALRPTARVHAIPNAGHAVYIEQPTAFNDIVLGEKRA